MPSRLEIIELAKDVEEIAPRRYFDAIEDERVLQTFARYLRVRAALAELIGDLEPAVWKFDTLSREDRLVAFAVAYAAACILMRSADTLIEVAADNQLFHEKLDQGDPRLGIPRKQFTAIYRGRTDPFNYLRFDVARRFAEASRDSVQGICKDKGLREIANIFQREHAAVAGFSKALSFTGGLRYRLHSLARRRRSSLQQVSFALFELAGRTVSQLRNPFHRKLVGGRELAFLKEILLPGDVVVTRHADAATNLFLPGFWPHAALHIGSEEARAAIGLEFPPEVHGRARNPLKILEALRDGVRFRNLESTLRVDAFVVIRPTIEQVGIVEALQRAASHEGKGYDFEFDFGRSDRLVCTEVIYRGFQGVGGLVFSLTERAGRPTFSAEDLLDMAVEDRGFEVVSVFGVGDEDQGLLAGESARQRVIESYRK